MSAQGRTPPPEVLHAKHRLLPEIGAAGQRALSEARFSADRSDAALDEAAELLVRSGLTLDPDAAPLTLPGDRVQRSDPALAPAADALAGALLATEKVREIVGVAGRPLGFPAALFEPAVHAAPPWVAGPIELDRAVLDAIRAHAEESYPSECCGLAAGPAEPAARVDAVEREVNEADKYHRLDPERFPRTSRTYFKINELRAAKAFDRGAAAGRPIKVIYHSHCDAGDYFSAEDAATFASEGQLMWPCVFLVVSVVNGKAISERLWAHVPGTDSFREAVLRVLD